MLFIFLICKIDIISGRTGLAYQSHSFGYLMFETHRVNVFKFVAEDESGPGAKAISAEEQSVVQKAPPPPLCTIASEVDPPPPENNSPTQVVH